MEEIRIEDIKKRIQSGKTVLGIELGSTRIKGVLLTEEGELIADGSHQWENRLENGIWTYSMEAVWKGMQECYGDLKTKVREAYGAEIETIGGIGISAMMHGYLAFDGNDELLVPFRTWRNTITEQASRELTEDFHYPIPQRWSIAHLYQAVLNGEAHVKDIKYITTLAGYVHWMLTGERVLGVDDASGMFPVDAKTGTYYTDMLDCFDQKISDRSFPWKIREILPRPLLAGEQAGVLTEEGAGLLDPEGTLKAGIPLCPPEGDAGTGMVATNSVKARTGNVSAGTSIFSMIVLEKELSNVYSEIDLVATPQGAPAAMVHCNNCTSDLNAWVNILKEFSDTFGFHISGDELYGGLFRKALEGDKDCGGLVACNYVSGESVAGFAEGRPLFVRRQDGRFNLANFIRTHLYAAFGTLKIGNDLLFDKEGVKVDVIWGHGGIFKTEGTAQKILAAALNTPVSVMKSAGEGGAWGIAVLALYMINKKEGEALEDYLEKRIFQKAESVTAAPEPEDIEGFNQFMENYKKGLMIEKAAVDAL